MFVIGLAGGIASGKSFVAECFVELGSEKLNADEIGHQVLSDPAVISQIQDRWGHDVIIDGQVDRRRLASLVFATDGGFENLHQLEAITHPRIGDNIRLQLKRISESNPSGSVVLDAPVMFKAKWDHLCNEIVFVESTREDRQRRAIQRGWPPGELERREQRQTQLTEKKNRCSHIIDNTKTKDHTMAQVKQLRAKWKLDTYTLH